ncbi:MAG TPA: hypothetical protein VMD75_03440 [Candidatus Binataceae bacterium]|nr:hypothetical protein [Candidatus Binataceae bacterium]
MQKAASLLLILAFCFIGCSRAPYGTITHRDSKGRPDQWVYGVDRDTYKIELDTNHDQRPDVIKTYEHNQLIKIEKDRNFDGRVDLVQNYSDGILTREVHDDNFDGKPEMIKVFRRGKLAMVELDSDECGHVDVVKYYDDTGRLIRREVRGKRLESTDPSQSQIIGNHAG